MKINEVERLTGITKKNIRFYEEQKLLAPHRNAENGYRVYTETDVQMLLRIKLFRKLGVPIEEIRQMLNGTHTVGDGMRRHSITLEREKQNLEHSFSICKELKEYDIPIWELEVENIFLQMDEMERSGASFQNKQKEDVRVQYVAPIAVAIFFLSTIVITIFALAWAYSLPSEEKPPIIIAVLIVVVLLGVGGGILAALFQRIREIGKGEVNDARKY